MIGKCEICYQTVHNDDNQLFCTSCDQDFHADCMTIYLSKYQRCPMCKSLFDLEKMAIQFTARDPTLQFVEEQVGYGGGSIIEPRPVQKREEKQAIKIPEKAMTPRQMAFLIFTVILPSTILAVLIGPLIFSLWIVFLLILVFNRLEV